MKWCRVNTDSGPVYGVLEQDVVKEVSGTPFGAYSETGRRWSSQEARLSIPVVPRNFYAVGANYLSHIEWANEHHGMSIPIPRQLDIGYRGINALVATGGHIVIPPDSPGPVEYEGELVAVIGRVARAVSRHDALTYVLGYTLGNDLSDRGWQQSDRTTWRAKNSDTFKPMGPVIDTGLDPQQQVIATAINGEIVSQYSTGKMLYSVAEIVERVSTYITLYPGDVIWLGTDGPTVPALKRGDSVEITNAEIGVLRNRIACEDDL